MGEEGVVDKLQNCRVPSTTRSDPLSTSAELGIAQGPKTNVVL